MAIPLMIGIIAKKQLRSYTRMYPKNRGDSSLYKYELFYTDLEENRTEQLTELQSSIVSPEFFHQSDQIAFLEYTNWASVRPITH